MAPSCAAGHSANNGTLSAIPGTKTIVTTVLWPTGELPVLRTAGEFPHEDRDFARQYGPAPYHALHLYDVAGAIRLGARELRFQRGDITLTPARVPSRYDLDRPGAHLCVHFLPPAQPPRGARVALPLHLSMAGRVELARDKLRWIAYLWGDAARSPLARAGASAALLELLLWLAASVEVEERLAGPRALAAVERAAHILSTQTGPLDVAHLAAQVELSRNYLARAFRARYGVTMARFLLRRRMAVAAHLLETTDLPVAQVGQRVGVDDPHYFNKQFRRAVGQSPSAFRARPARSGSSPGGARGAP